MRKLVIIPTYNEKENISAMISKVFSLEEAFEMLVIDDGSPDGTAAIVRERHCDFLTVGSISHDSVRISHTAQE